MCLNYNVGVDHLLCLEPLALKFLTKVMNMDIFRAQRPRAEWILRGGLVKWNVRIINGINGTNERTKDIFSVY